MSDSDIDELFTLLCFLGEEVQIDFYHLPLYPSDPDDIPFLLCALNGEATHLVSHDDHLLVLGDFYPLKICPPLAFLRDLR